MLYTFLLCFQVLIGSDYHRDDYVKRSAWSKARKAVLVTYSDSSTGDSRCMYTGTVQDPHNLDIDHVVPAKYAHDHGLSDSSVALKRMFGVDTMNLVPVSASVNRSKRDHGPSQFMPAINSCWYADRWLAVTKKYNITVTRSDKHVIDSTHKACKEQK